MKKPRRVGDQPRVKTAVSEVVLWRPSIVLASRIEAPARRKPVTLAAPTAQPDSGEERIVGSILMAAYRLEASFDQALTGAYRRVSALMEERGLS
jgi:hypothetical protein